MQTRSIDSFLALHFCIRMFPEEHIQWTNNKCNPKFKNKIKVANAVNVDNTFLSKTEQIISKWWKMKRRAALVLSTTNIWMNKTSKPTPDELTQLVNVEFLEKLVQWFLKWPESSTGKVHCLNLEICNSQLKNQAGYLNWTHFSKVMVC